MAKIIKIPSVMVYDTKVVGVSKPNEDGTSRQEIIRKEVEEEDKLTLQEETENPHDPNAVKVLSKSGNQMGYLNREIAQTVRSAILNEAEVHATVTWVNGNELLGVGLRIELVS